MRRQMGWLAPILVCLLVSTAAARKLHAIDCAAAEKECSKVSCDGVLKTECDATTGKVECLCQSAGLASCFPGAATVTVSTGAAKPLAALALGEEVLAVGSDGRLRYSPVVMFSSRRPAQRAAFVRVHTDAGLNITATPGHYLFAWKAAAAATARAALSRPASWPYVLPTQLEVGDLVPVAGAAAAAGGGGGRPLLARVTAIDRVMEDGVYMPHTLTGAIVVDGVVASELTSVVPPALAGAVFQRGMAAALRAACTLLPPHLVEAAVRGVASWAHGTPDASISHAAMAASGASRA